MSSFKGAFVCLLTAFLWGLGFVAQYLGSEKISAFTFMLARCLIGVVTIFVIIILRNYFKYKKFVFFEKSDDKKILIKTSILTGIVLAFAMECQQIGIAKTTVAKAGFIASLNLICVPIILNIFYKNRLRTLTKVFIGIALVGFFLLNMGEDRNILITTGDLWCLLSTLFFSIDVVLISKKGESFDGLKFSLFRFITVLIISIIFVVVIERKIDIEGCKNAILALLYAGVVVTGIAYSLQIIGEKYCEPVIATMIMGLEGVFASIFGFLILNQDLSLYQILGCIMILFSTIMVQIVNRENA